LSGLRLIKTSQNDFGLRSFKDAGSPDRDVATVVQYDMIADCSINGTQTAAMVGVVNANTQILD